MPLQLTQKNVLQALSNPFILVLRFVLVQFFNQASYTTNARGELKPRTSLIISTNQPYTHSDRYEQSLCSCMCVCLNWAPMGICTYLQVWRMHSSHSILQSQPWNNQSGVTKVGARVETRPTRELSLHRASDCHREWADQCCTTAAYQLRDTALCSESPPWPSLPSSQLLCTASCHGWNGMLLV